ncbi:hypothetical protein EDB84DRAFT_1438558 [Lactarius hengduanensis]|nr:hypothetical protein EDB84DRAFT_1438558 [Lactarius hengduanensis]
MSGLDPISFAGVLGNIEPSNPADVNTVMDDLEGECETIPDLEEADGALDGARNASVTDLLTTVNDASRGVSDRTHDEYRRLIAQCTEFLVQTNLVAPSEFFSDKPHPYAPQFIVAWIMNESAHSHSRKSHPHRQCTVRATYGTAQKMRASMTYAFGRIHGLGSAHWERCADGRTVGNPSVSEMVSRYMLSLHRRKVKAGETATSARAISADTLKKLYHFNFRPEFRGKRDYAPGRKKADDQWGGSRYTIAFTCLLRVDEALKIQSQDITMLSKNKFQLTLPLRKTSQFGNIEPFVLHRMPKSMAHLCPVRAYAAWLKVSRISHGWPLTVYLRVGRLEHRTNAPDDRQYLISWNDDLLQKREDFFDFDRTPAMKCLRVAGRATAPDRPRQDGKEAKGSGGAYRRVQWRFGGGRCDEGTQTEEDQWGRGTAVG